jgi:hypothetical protein
MLDGFLARFVSSNADRFFDRVTKTLPSPILPVFAAFTAGIYFFQEKSRSLTGLPVS